MGDLHSPQLLVQPQAIQHPAMHSHQQCPVVHCSREWFLSAAAWTFVCCEYRL